MKAGQADLKERYAKLGGIDDIDKLMDSMADMNDEIQETNEVLSTAYAVPDGFDEASCEAEFNAIEEELTMERLSGINTAPPSYLTPATTEPGAVPATTEPTAPTA